MNTWKAGLVCAAFLLVALGVPSGTARACTTSQFDLTEKEDLPRYSFVLFYKPGSPDGDASMAVLKDMAKKWGPRANVDFEYVDVTSERGVKIAKYWQVTEFPVTYVITPSGWSLATFKGKLAVSDVEPLMTSPGKAALLDGLKKNKAVFLVLGTKKMKGYGETVKAAEKAAKSAKDAMKIQVGTVIVDPADPKEAKLVRNLGLEKPPTDATVYVTFGKGRAVLSEVQGEGLEERLAFTIQLLSTADQCSMGMEIRGEPLLLGK